MNEPRVTARFPWTVLFASAALAAASRAILIGARDGYLVAGLVAVGVKSAARHFLAGLPACFAAALLVGLITRARRPRATRTRLALGLSVAVLAYAFISGRIPDLGLLAPGTSNAKALAAHVAAGLAAASLGGLIAFSERLGPRFVRGLAAGSAAMVVAAGAARLAALAPGDQAPARPNVILISLDTVRADHLGCYGYSAPTTPEIDHLAEKAVRFAVALAPEPWTLSSHMTMLTSLEPGVHGVGNDHPLPAGIPTLAQLLREHDFLAFAQVSHIGWMRESYGLARGFHLYRRFTADAGARQPAIDELLDDLGGERFFLFLHYYDAHSDWRQLPYDSAPEDRTLLAGWYAGNFTGVDAHGRRGSKMLHRAHEEPPLSGDDLRYVISLYDAGLRGLDRALGVLFRSLEERGLLDTSLVVLTADHGEEFFEHGRFLHTQLYEESMRVPLIIRPPGGVEGRESMELAGVIDVAPTILELCGIDPPPEMQGESLAPIVRGEREALARSQLLLVESSTGPGLRTKRWKFLKTGAAPELYDLLRDPGEHENLLAGGDGRPEAQELERLLEEELQHAAERRARITPAGAIAPMGEAEAEELQALGY